MFRKITAYFDLAEGRRGILLENSESSRPGLLIEHWLPQYLALLLGIASEQWVVPLMKPDSVTSPLLSGLWISLVAGIVIFPAAYKKSFDRDQPWFYHFATIFTIGLGWRSLFP